ncbi:MAG: hypothetical protein M3229_01505, partial [Actinomycetota bacterium]|nr:hypothetical protein [Actinomycetota bacterium]
MLETAFSIAFAAAVLVVAASYVLAGTGRLRPRITYGLAALIGVAAAAGWIAFAFEQELELALSAGGLMLAAAAEAAAVAIARLVTRGRRLDAEFAGAERRLRELIEREAAERAAELERTLARARADSVSRLAEEERRIADERRRLITEREAISRDELAGALAAAQQNVERRIAEWTQDLDRVQNHVATEIARIGDRQRELIAQAEARIATDAERIMAESDEQRVAVSRLREELARTVQEVAQSAAAELDAQAAERRRALHEVADRLRRREEQLAEQIEREESDAISRIAMGFAEIERRQLEQLERAVDRATSGYAELAAQQFAEAVKDAREDAARRLARELDRAVTTFEREANGVLAERLAQISDTGALRLEKRLSQITAGLERQRDEAVVVLEARFAEAESEIRRRVQALA